MVDVGWVLGGGGSTIETIPLVDEDDIPPEALMVDDSLNPLDSLLLYSNSEFNVHRIFSVRDLFDTAQSTGLEDTVSKILPVLSGLSDDTEPAVRTALLEQIPNAARYLAQCTDGAGYPYITSDLWPLVQMLLLDEDVSVQGSARSAVAGMCMYLREIDLENHVMPKLLELANDITEEDNRVEAFMLMKELCATFGVRLCMEAVVPEIVRSIKDSSFRVRKAGVEVLSELCGILNSNDVMTALYPTFQELLRDKVWGVRKACAQTLPSIAKAVPLNARLVDFVGVFRQLSNDTSRWVRMAAYEALGPLIATFVNESLPPVELVRAFEQMSQVDADLTECCAFNFPAVVLAVGKDGWPGLKQLYLKLCNDMQWKVRRTLSHSIHAIAEIVGTEIADADLVPLFDLFIQDVDEIRIGPLSHLSEFVAVLSPPYRLSYLSILQELLIGPENHLWRCRELLAVQLHNLCQLYSPKDVAEHVAPLCVLLAQDNIASVRESIKPAVVRVLSRLGEGETKEQYQLYLDEIKMLGTDQHYQRRQLFSQLAPMFFENMSTEDFIAHIAPTLMQLTRDKVANVRLAVATSLCNEQFRTQIVSFFPSLVSEGLVALAKDKDIEVSRVAKNALSPSTL